MNEHERPVDPAYDRLVAADPARRSTGPVQGVLRAKVDALIAEQAGQEPTGPGPAERGQALREQAEHGDSARGPVGDLAVRRHRRRAPWLVAAAVAGIVAAGGGGYVAGEQGLGIVAGSMEDTTAGAEDGSPSVLGMPDEAVPDEAVPDEAVPESDEGSASGAETEGVEPFGVEADLPATGLVFHAGVGLSDSPTTAQVRVAEESSRSEGLGSYPVVSEREAVERLGDPRFAGAALGWSQVSPSDDAGPRTAPAPGGPIVWPVQDVTIVAATLTEMRYPLSDGTVLFVPAYELTDAEGSSWTVMAVDDELLDFAP